ncbi:MAG: DMT family transporter [Candidatus Gracilibacteria bacterium]|jgi:drug/metabolite transporter (DMT)-like permease
MTNEKKKMIIGYTCAVAATMFWGIHAVIIRWLLNGGVHPFLVGDLRLFIGSTFLAVVVSFTTLIKEKKLFPKVHYSKFFWLISISLAVNFVIFHIGLKYTIASDAILLEAFSPIAVLVIVMIFMPDKIKHLMKVADLPYKILLTLVIGSIGSALLLINDPKDLLITSHSKLIGDAIEFVAMFTWALVLLGMHEYQQREGSKYNILAATSQFLFFAGVMLAPFVPWTEMTAISSQQWIWITVLSVGSTGISYVLWHLASRYLDIFPLMTLFSLASIFTIITESAFLGLQITWKLAIGAGLILYAAIQAKKINSKYKTVNESTLGEGTGSQKQ